MTIWRAASGIAAIALLAACDAKEQPPPPAQPAPQAPPPPVVKPPTLTRTDILAALSKAASDHAAGLPLDRGLTGRTFALRLAFGCPGLPIATAPVDGLPSADWSKDRKTIRLSFKPADWSQSALVLTAGESATWDGVEGVWLARPWTLAEGCPALVAQPAPSATEAEPTPPPVFSSEPMSAGLAAILNADSSRLGRREGEAYSFVVRGEDDLPPAMAEGGYRLVLEGRLSAFADGAAIRCTAASALVRPVCVAAVQLDVVAFETAAGARLSEWRPS